MNMHIVFYARICSIWIFFIIEIMGSREDSLALIFSLCSVLISFPFRVSIEKCACNLNKFFSLPLFLWLMKIQFFPTFFSTGLLKFLSLLCHLCRCCLLIPKLSWFRSEHQCGCATRQEIQFTDDMMCHKNSSIEFLKISFTETARGSEELQIICLFIYLKTRRNLFVED